MVAMEGPVPPGPLRMGCSCESAMQLEDLGISHSTCDADQGMLISELDRPERGALAGPRVIEH